MFLWLHLRTISVISLEIFNENTADEHLKFPSKLPFTVANYKARENGLHSVSLEVNAFLISMGKWTEKCIMKASLFTKTNDPTFCF